MSIVHHVKLFLLFLYSFSLISLSLSLSQLSFSSLKHLSLTLSASDMIDDGFWLWVLVIGCGLWLWVIYGWFGLHFFIFIYFLWGLCLILCICGEFVGGWRFEFGFGFDNVGLCWIWVWQWWLHGFTQAKVVSTSNKPIVIFQILISVCTESHIVHILDWIKLY